MSDGSVTVAQCVECLPLGGRFMWELLLCGFILWFLLGTIAESTPLAFTYMGAGLTTTTEHLSALAAALAFGNLVAVVISGWAADQYGRAAVLRPVLLFTAFCGMFLQCAADFRQAVFAQFLLGLASGALLCVFPPLVAELVPARHRGFYMTVWLSGWPAGAATGLLAGSLMPGLSGRIFHFLLFVPSVAVYACLRAEVIPESPRYLYLVGRRDEGYEVLLDLYEKEDMVLPWDAEVIEFSSSESTSQLLGSVVSLSCHSNGKRKTSSDVFSVTLLMLSVFLATVAAQVNKIWMPALVSTNHQKVASSTSMAASTMINLLALVPQPYPSEANYFVVLFLSQAYVVQLFGIVLCAYASVWVKRRHFVLWSLAAAAFLAFPTVGCIKAGGYFLTFSGVLLGSQMAAQACGLNFLLVFAIEHFPTSKRALVFGSACMAAQIGNLVAPFLGEIAVERLSKGAIIVFFSLLNVVAWCFCGQLPLSTSRETTLLDVDDEPRCQANAKTRLKNAATMSYRTI